MTRRLQRLGVVGAGAWGTALAVALRRAGRDVVLWARRAELAAELAASRESAAYLPGVALDAAIAVTADPAAPAEADALLLVTPAQHLRSVVAGLAPHLRRDVPLVVCSKGIERGSGKLMTEVLAEVAPGRPTAVLSGPTFAAEVGRGLPTAVTLAATDAALGEALVAALGSRTFRPYLSDDPLGAQVGGAVKNVIAIACGIVAGRELGENARAALITRGLAEVARLGRCLGARPETFAGLAGLGDLTLTSTSRQSRNYALGAALGAGQSLAEATAGRRSVAEGAFTAHALIALAAAHRIEMPISTAVAAILDGRAAIDEEIAALLARPFRSEVR